MQQEINQKRIRNMYTMFFEMANGNFSYRIPRTDRDDDLEALSVLANMLAQEMAASILHLGYINPKFSYNYLLYAALILDDNFTIESFSPKVPSLLGLEEDTMYGKEFSMILDKKSWEAWEEVKEKCRSDASSEKNLQLTFVTGSNMLLPASCTVSKLLYTNKFLISSLSPGRQFSLAQHPLTTLEKKSSVAEKMGKVYDYITSHLDAQLPPLRELAHRFGTNEFTLKRDFKRCYGISIYKCYHEQRLEKALLLIKQTDIPIKTIAFMSGFSNYPNFSKAFKKKLGYCPNATRKYKSAN